MNSSYLEYTFNVNPAVPGNEILIAELSELGFESFVEQETGILAYIQKEPHFPEDAQQSQASYSAYIADLFILQSADFEISFTVKEIEQVNWNEEWEKHFDPIDVDGQCTIRAPFHPKTDTPYDIVISPKMAFGTGHHETTYMMVKLLLGMELSRPPAGRTGKRILDMGCGTGVLAMLAEMRGAQPIDAIDIDSWAYENTLENIGLNGCQHIQVYEGDATLLSGKQYDVIIANINRNILLQDIPTYASCLADDGMLLLSGFYEEDIALITETCNAHHLYFVANLKRNNWVACKFEKRLSN